MSVLTQKNSTIQWPTAGQQDWQAANELLQTRFTRHGSAPQGQLSRGDILSLLHCIGQAVSRTQNEMAWHQHACAKACKRENELKQQLQAVLTLLNQDETPELKPGLSPLAPSDEALISGDEIAGSALNADVWQHVLGLLSRRPEGRPAQPAISLPAPEKAALPKTPPQAEPALAALVIYCLGPFRVYQNEQPLTGWTNLKSQAILKYLLTHHGASTSKDTLMEVFWPEASPEAARRNLHQAIYCLRQTLKQNLTEDIQPIQFENDCYFLNPALTVWLDSAEFERHARAGRQLEAAGHVAAAMAEYSYAEALYQGDFLEEDLFEDWTGWQREHLRITYLDLADHLSEYYLQQGEIETTISLCQKILERDNCYEQAHRRLMICYQREGQRHLAIRQYQLCVQRLEAELDVPPSAETQGLYERISGGEGF